MIQEITSVIEAWQYYRKIQSGFTRIGSFSSKSKHGGQEGITHIISMSHDAKTKEYLSKKEYWWTGWAPIAIDKSLIPRSDFGLGGETLKTKMIDMWRDDLKDCLKVIHVIVMQDTSVYIFDGEVIINYIDIYNTWIDDKFVGFKQAAGYPSRLAYPILGLESKQTAVKNQQKDSTLFDYGDKE